MTDGRDGHFIHAGHARASGSTFVRQNRISGYAHISGKAGGGEIFLEGARTLRG